VIVPFNSSTQQISVYNYAGSTDVVADLDGYFAPALPSDLEPTTCVPTGYTSTLTFHVTPVGSDHFQLMYGAGNTGNISNTAGAGVVTSDLLGIGVPNASVTPPSPPGTYTITWDSNVPITGTGDGFTVLSYVVTGIYSASCPEYYPGSLYVGLIAPHRIVDTRFDSGSTYQSAPQILSGVPSGIGPFSTLDIQILPDTSGPVTGYYAPGNFSGVDVNVTVTDGSAASYLEIYPAQGGVGLGQTQLNGLPSSDINWNPGEIISNGDLLATEADFPAVSIDAFNWNGYVDVVVDVYGYFFIPS
jgi:hypothetical protein